MIKQNLLLPASNTLWKHSKGATYKVLMITNEATDKPIEYPITVVYQDTETNKVWSRPFIKWHESMTSL